MLFHEIMCGYRCEVAVMTAVATHSKLIRCVRMDNQSIFEREMATPAMQLSLAFFQAPSPKF